MEDLNNLYLFSQVVEYNGFSGAARALGVARSSVCRRVGQLEDELGVRLVQRSTRRFAVTELGLELHGDCLKMLAEARAGYDRVARARARPSGVIRLSCPAIVAHLLVGPLIPQFVAENPEVRLAIEANSQGNETGENFDLLIRLKQIPCQDSAIVVRSLGIAQQVLVASKAFLDRVGRPSRPDEAGRLPSIALGHFQGPHLWKFIDAEERETQIRLEPHLIFDDMTLACRAAVQGLGIAQLPLPACREEIQRGLLETLLPDHPIPLLQIQIAFPSRRGMLPAVRTFIDFLSAHSVDEVARWQIKRHVDGGPREPRILSSPQRADAAVARFLGGPQLALASNVAESVT